MIGKKILIADDHSIVRAGLAMIIESELGNLQIQFADTYQQARTAIANDRFDLLILDINIPGGIFKSMIKDLRHLQDYLKIMIFSTYKEDVGVQYIMAGANAFLCKTASEMEIVQAVSSLLKNDYYYTPQIMSEIGSKINITSPINKLSEREFEVYKLLVAGNGNIEISNTLDLKMSTISTYKKKIFEKLKIKSIVELLRINDSLH